GFIFSCITCSDLMLLSYFGMDMLYTHALDNVFLKSGILDFLHVKVLGLPFLMFTQLFNALFIALDRSRLLIWGAVAGNIAVIFFDYGLIFGNFGLPVLGVQGASWASLTGEVVLAATTFAVYCLRGLHIAYPIVKGAKKDSAVIRNMIQVSTPLVLQY